MAVAGFWIFLAAVFVAAEWRKKNIELARLETMRLLIEKNQNLDEAKLKELLNPSPFLAMKSAMKSQQKPGDVYRGLRGTGTVILFVALGLIIAAMWIYSVRGITDDVVGLGVSVPIVALVGVGLFFSSRFAAKPPSDEDKD